MGFLFRFLSFLPLPLLHNLGAAAGWLIWLLSPTYRRHLRENTALAGLAEARGAAIAEAGKAIFELPKLWLRPHDEVVARIVKVSGWELVEEAWQVGRGILFLTPHLGCFEITAQYYANFRPMTVLYRRPKQDWLVPIIEQGRGANLELAPADMSGLKKLLKALKQGGAVGMLPDQAPGAGEGVWAPFFGRPAYTMTLAARLVQQTGAALLLAWAERLPQGRGYLLRIARPTQPLPVTAADDEALQLACASAINAEMERLIAQCPGQYLWGYNRYKQPRKVHAATGVEVAA